jgi:hypothetical protein
VAELLARYGEAAPSTGRRRRRAPEDSNTAPQSIIERVRTDSAPLPTVGRLGPRRSVESDQDGWKSARDGLDQRGSASAAFDSAGWSEPDAHPGLNGYDSPGLADFDSRGLNGYDGPRLADFDSGSPGPSAPDGRNGYRNGADPGEDTWMGLPPVGAGREPLNGRGVSGGPITDQLPRLDPLPPDPPRAEPAARPAQRSGEWQPAAGLGTSARPVPQRGGPGSHADEETQLHDALADVPDGMVQPGDEDLYHADGPIEDFEAESFADEATSPVREWAVMASQIGVGVVGGAVLWLICEWLWQRIPVVALVVALLVITGLVWVVRRVRRAEDLQTTVIAVLVGLFVTVSPAALLLVGR